MYVYIYIYIYIYREREREIGPLCRSPPQCGHVVMFIVTARPISVVNLTCYIPLSLNNLYV